MALLMLAASGGPEAQAQNLEWLKSRCTGADGSAVGGSVLQLGSLTPAPGAVVVVGHNRLGADDDPWVTTTDDAGRFAVCSVGDVPMVNIKAYRGTEASRSLGVGISDSLTWGGDLVLDPIPRATVIGRVFDSGSGEPVVGATVAIPRIGTSTTTDDLGCFRLSGLPTREVLLETSHEAFLSRTDTLASNPPDTSEVAIDLGPERRALSHRPLVLDQGRVTTRPADLMVEGSDAQFGAALTAEALSRPGTNELRIEGGPAAGFLCVEEAARHEDPGCQMAAVLWDGRWAPTPGRLLAHMDPNRIGRVGFVASSNARKAFCSRGANGVLLIGSTSEERPEPTEGWNP